MLVESKDLFPWSRIAPGQRSLFDDDDNAVEARDRLKATLEEYIRFLTSDYSYAQYIERMTEEQLNYFVTLDGFLPSFSGRLDVEQSLDLILSRTVGRQLFRRDWNLDIGKCSVFAGRLVLKQA